MKQCSCGRLITRKNGLRCVRCTNLAELHGRWDRDRAPEPKLAVVPPATKTGRLEALIWVHMVFQSSKNPAEFQDRLNREIAALEDDD